MLIIELAKQCVHHVVCSSGKGPAESVLVRSQSACTSSDKGDQTYRHDLSQGEKNIVVNAVILECSFFRAAPFAAKKKKYEIRS